jgi:hypothetical protein
MSTVNVTEPPPVPVLPDVIVTHDTGLAAVQLQPPGVVTVTVPEPPDAATDTLVGVMANEQPGCGGGGSGGGNAAAAWLIVTVWPATVALPDRASPVFEATAS